jgi:hypothetical protein
MVSSDGVNVVGLKSKKASFEEIAKKEGFNPDFFKREKKEKEEFNSTFFQTISNNGRKS